MVGRMTPPRTTYGPALQVLAAVAASSLLAGCDGDEPDPGATTAAQHSEALGEGQVLLDARADGARLVGRPLPVPDNADPDRVVSLEAQPRDIAPQLDGQRVLDARFVEGALLVLGADHVLRVHRGGASERLDTQVHGPLGVSGAAVTYVRGQAPQTEVVRADVSSGSTTQVTRDMAPAWNPALSPDGRTVYFVSGASGQPRLMRTGGGGTVALDTERFPASVTAPRVVDGTLVFEDERGVVWLDLATGRVEHAVEGRRGLAFLPGGKVVDGRLRPFEEPAP